MRLCFIGAAAGALLMCAAKADVNRTVQMDSSIISDSSSSSVALDKNRALNPQNIQTPIDTAVKIFTIAAGGAAVIALVPQITSAAFAIKTYFKQDISNNVCRSHYTEDSPYSNGVKLKIEVCEWTTGNDCKSTAQDKTFDNAIKACFQELHDRGASAGNCALNHRGTWNGCIKVTSDGSDPVRLLCNQSKNC